MILYALIFAAALYLLATSLICTERNDGHHAWCPLCWCIALYMRCVR